MFREFFCVEYGCEVLFFKGDVIGLLYEIRVFNVIRYIFCICYCVYYEIGNKRWRVLCFG